MPRCPPLWLEVLNQFATMAARPCATTTSLLRQQQGPAISRRFVYLSQPVQANSLRPRNTSSSTDHSNKPARLQPVSVAAPERTAAAAAMESSSGQACESSPHNAIEFMMLMHNLKINKRTGWVLRDVQQPESIADHMYRMAAMALLLAGTPGVDHQRCMMMAIVHDMAEAIVGDITPHCGVSAEEKKALEAAAVQKIRDTVGSGTRAAALIEELWREYEGASSPTAQLVKDFDKVELILQAYEYELAQGRRLDEFFASTAGKFKTNVGKQWAAEVLSRRERMWQQRDAGGAPAAAAGGPATAATAAAAAAAAPGGGAGNGSSA